MNKTVTINLSGIVFHIEEAAYEKLGKYLNTIKGYFNDSDGRDEIMSDIESRIAEMLTEKNGTNKQVVTMQDIDDVISVMGKPEEFASGEKTEESKQEEKYSHTQQTYQSSKRRRVFRDPDEKVLGGVCSGIASHFDFDPIWLRIGFAIAFFGFGTGLLLYILLWMIIPEAKTTAEKLEMRGEPINVENIKKTVNDEVEHLKKKVNELKDEIGSKKNRDKFSSTANKVTGLIEQIFKTIFRVIGKTLSVFLLIFCVLMLVAFFAMASGVKSVHIHNATEMSSYTLKEISNIFFLNESHTNMAILGALLLLAIPLISVTYWAIRTLFGVKKKNRFVGMTLMGLWLTGLGIMIYISILTTNDFGEKSTVLSEQQLQQPKNGVLYLKGFNDKFTTDTKYSIREKHITLGGKYKYRNDWSVFEIQEKTILLGAPELSVEKSVNDSFSLEVIYQAHGEGKKEAGIRAENIKYNFLQTDSVVEFSKFFEVNKDDKWRNQQVKMILRVPVGKTIFLDKSMKYIIYDVENLSNTYDHDMLDRRWIMNTEGLRCIDCEGLKTRNHSKTVSDDNFNEIEVSDAIDVYVTQGESNSIKVEADKETLEDIKTEIESGTLKIYDSGINLIKNRKPAKVFVTVTELDKISLSGASTLESMNNIKSHHLAIEVSGASKAKIQTESQTIKAEITGASSISFTGNTETLLVELSGASTLISKELTAKEVELDLTGASKSEINVSEQLKANATGASKINYTGNPKKTDIDTDNSSTVSFDK